VAGVLLLGLWLTACAGSRDSLRPPPDHDPMNDVQGRQLFDQGIALARSGDLVRAEQYLASSITRGMAEERVLPLLLEVCVAASRFRAAVSYAEPYLQRHPQAWRLRFLVATIRVGLNDSMAARRDLEEVLRAREDHAEAHFVLASMLREHFNDPAGADPHFRRYLAIEPTGAHADEARSGLLQQVNHDPERGVRGDPPVVPGAGPALPGRPQGVGDHDQRPQPDLHREGGQAHPDGRAVPQP
jgi:Tfp pilus assembly protein PilF